jgi:hypothetical protein
LKLNYTLRKIAKMQTKYPSSRFAKADRCFTQRIWQNLHANVALFSTPMNRNRARSKAYFTKIYFEFQMPINSKVVCLEKKCTTLVFGDLEVFKENFVERGKVLTGSNVQGCS